MSSQRKPISLKLRSLKTPKSLEWRILGIIAFLTISSVVYLFTTDLVRTRNIAISDKVKEYTVIDLDASYSSLIDSLWVHRGFAMVDLSDHQKIAINLSRNHDYDPYSISKFLKVNDQLYKSKSSDTLWIYRDDDIFYFCIGQVINNNEKK